MSPLRISKLHAGCLSAWAASVALSAQAQYDTFGGDPSTNAFIRIPSDTDDWTRHFRLGAMVGLNIKANFSMSGSFPVSGSDPGAGYFSTGNYVVPDATGDKTYTANWGYSSATQLNGSTLTMTGANSYTASGSSSADGGFLPGLDLAYGGNLWYWKHARVGWELGFGWLPIDIKSNQALAAQVSQTTYTFNTGSIVVPEAPYQGNPSGTGPLIPLKGTPGAPTISDGVVTGTHELDVDLYTLRLGPSIYWDVTERVGISFGAGPAVGLVDGDYKYNETVTVNGLSTPNSGQIGATDFTFGGYVNATLMYHLVANGDLYLGAQYMPMENVTITGAGRSGQLNLDGQIYVSVGINWPF